MAKKINIIRGQKPVNTDVLRFQKEARIIYETRVKPQVKKALKTDLPKQVITCNNPV